MGNLAFLIYDVERKEILNWNHICGSKLQIKNSDYLKEHNLIDSVEDPEELGGGDIVLILVSRDYNLEYKTEFSYTMEQGEELSEFFTNSYNRLSNLIEVGIGYIRVISDESELKVYKIDTVFNNKTKTCRITGKAGTSECLKDSNFNFINDDFQDFLNDCIDERERKEILVDHNVVVNDDNIAKWEKSEGVIAKSDNMKNVISIMRTDYENCVKIDDKEGYVPTMSNWKRASEIIEQNNPTGALYNGSPGNQDKLLSAGILL